jgi:cyclomaltodextrinase
VYDSIEPVYIVSAGVCSVIKTPDWVKDAIFYQIFPERFARSDRLQKPSNLEAWDSPPTSHGFKGGDLLGVAEHLDYLDDLGINAIYFNPIFQSASNHRYHTHDYYRVDPLLGGDAAFKELLDAAHARGIRIVLDGVFNHASRGFFQFNHILECGEQSPYLDWFTVKGFPLYAYDHTRKPNYAAWVGLHALPEFNTDNPQVREFIFGVAEYWVRFGIDGWRLDVPYEIDDDSFWQEFRRRVLTANPDTYIVGEIWHEAQRWLQGDQFDAVMNYVQTRAAIAFFGAQTLAPLEPGGGYKRLSPLSAPDFAREIERMLGLYDWEITSAQLNLLGSHDTPRFITMVNGNKSALKLAMLFQMTMPGAPTIYYGDEIGLSGGYDPGSRGGMPWDRARWDMDLLDYVRATVHLRRAHPALRRGTYRTLLAEGECYAFERVYQAERLVVAFNTADQDMTLRIPFESGAGQPDVVFGSAQASFDGDTLVLQAPPRSGIVIAFKN